MCRTKIYTGIILLLIIIAISFTYLQLKKGGEESLEITYDVEIESNSTSRYTVYLPYPKLIDEYTIEGENVEIDEVDTENGELVSVSGRGNITIFRHYKEYGNCIWNPINFSSDRISLTCQKNETISKGGEYWVYVKKIEENNNLSLNMEYNYIVNDQFVYSPFQIILNGSISQGWNIIRDSGEVQKHYDKFGTLSGAKNLSIFVDAVIFILIIVLIMMIRSERGKRNGSEDEN